jgi:flavorubredoxin
MEDTKTLEVSPDVQWVGVLDADLVTFDVVMETKYGTTYNSYYINADKKTVVDTVKEKYWPVFYEKLKSCTDPAEIEYIIVNHTEPDHSGSLVQLMSVAPNAIVIGTGNAIRYLNDLIGNDFPHKIVKDGDTLDLGNKTLRFIGAPNLHWPDTMYTYLVEDKLLFTCDSFGCHYCHEGMFDDKVGNFDDAFHFYYEVILKPYSKFMLKAIEKISPLEISVLCPGHGPILRTNWKKWVDLSRQYAEEALKYPRVNRVLIAYVSAYQNTRKMAHKIAEGLKDADCGLEIDLCDMESLPLGELERRVIEANAIIVGSPLINQNILLHVYQLFAILNPIRDRGKLAGAFGSYGWSGDFMKNLQNNLENIKLDFFGEGVFVRFTPHQADLERAYNYGKDFGLHMAEKGSKPCH